MMHVSRNGMVNRVAMCRSDPLLKPDDTERELPPTSHQRPIGGRATEPLIDKRGCLLDHR
jgi:hypothetical protein